MSPLDVPPLAGIFPAGQVTLLPDEPALAQFDPVVSFLATVDPAQQPYSEYPHGQLVPAVFNLCSFVVVPGQQPNSDVSHGQLVPRLFFFGV